MGNYPVNSLILQLNNSSAPHFFMLSKKNRIKIRQNKYLNNLIEQGHRNIKRQVRTMLGFGSFRTSPYPASSLKNQQADFLITFKP